MNEEYVSARLANPPGDIYPLLTTGNSIRFGIYFDKATKKRWFDVSHVTFAKNSSCEVNIKIEQPPSRKRL